MLVSEYANREFGENELTKTLALVSAWRAGSVFYPPPLFKISGTWDLLSPEYKVLLNGKGRKYMLLKCKSHIKAQYCRDHTCCNGVDL